MHSKVVEMKTNLAIKVAIGWCLMQYFVADTCGHSAGGNETLHRANGFTIDDLMKGKFTHKVSDDIDMDPCKSSRYKCHKKAISHYELK